MDNASYYYFFFFLEKLRAVEVTYLSSLFFFFFAFFFLFYRVFASHKREGRKGDVLVGVQALFRSAKAQFRSILYFSS